MLRVFTICLLFCVLWISKSHAFTCSLKSQLIEADVIFQGSTNGNLHSKKYHSSKDSPFLKKHIKYQIFKVEKAIKGLLDTEVYIPINDGLPSSNFLFEPNKNYIIHADITKEENFYITNICKETRLLSQMKFESKNCNIFTSEYVPLKQKGDSNLKLTIHPGEVASGQQTRNIFLHFTAYDVKTDKKLSMMRLSDAYSLGIAIRGFSSYWGQFNDYLNMKEFTPSADFQVIGVNQDLSPANIEDAPPLLIFPNSSFELDRKSHRHPEHWKHYIKFYTPEKIYPDFRGKDFWKRSKCGKDIPKYETILKCADTETKIISYCENKYVFPYCKEQYWVMPHQKIRLSADEFNNGGFDARSWQCADSNDGKKLVFFYLSGGNCPTCERYEIWNLEGTKVSEWQRFEENYKKLDFSKYKEDRFFDNFNKINRGVQK